MAEWKDVIHQIVRICKLQKGACGTCVLNAESCPNSVRFDLSDETGFVNIEKAIMTWAAEHPEPVYETWLEFIKRYETGKPKSDNDFIYWMGTTPIPADIAERLGLEPKEIKK